ncbi:MAG: EFR1 family ferrodoxin [Mangrovibacterium sp.]
MSSIKNVTTFYFSGTGNAKQIALWFSEFAAKKGIDCKMYDIAKCDTRTISTLIDNTLILIISPIHGFNFPKITLDFIRHFPKGNNRIALMNTRAGMKIGKFVTPGLTGIAFMLSSVILRNKGYRIVGQIPFDMPSNWISIHPALNKRTVKYLHKINYDRVEKHSYKIFSGQRDFLAYRDLVQDIFISPVAFAYYCLGRFIFAKSFYASTDCDNCGLCIKQCPVQAIKTVNARPYWTFKCESCMRCMNHCPKKSIDTAHGLIVMVSILNSIIFTALLHNVFKFDIESAIVRLVMSTGVFIVLMWIFYYLQHLLLKNRIIAKIISFASLTYYEYWGRYKSIPDREWKK